MASAGMSAMMLAACFAFWVMVAAAHEGHHHTPGMDMSPAPAPSENSSTLATPSMVIGLIAFIVSIVVVRERV